MIPSWIYNELVLKITKLPFKHRQSIGKVKLDFNTSALPWKVAVKRCAVGISICLHLSKCRTNLHIPSPNNKHLMTGPEGNS